MHGPTHRDDNAQHRRHRAAVAVVVVIALGAFALLLRSEPAEPIALVDATTARREHAPESEQASAARSKEPSARVADSQAAPLLEDRVDLALPHEFTLRVIVRDPFGLPIQDARLYLAPENAALTLWPDATDARGILEAKAFGRATRLRVIAAVSAYGRVEPMQSLVLDAGVTSTAMFVASGKPHEPEALLELLLQEEGDLQQATARATERVLANGRRTESATRQGKVRRRDEFEALCGRTLLLYSGMRCRNCHDAAMAAHYDAFASAPTLRESLHPRGVFSDLRSRESVHRGDREDRDPDRLRIDLDDLRKRLERTPRDAAKSKAIASSSLGAFTGIVRDASGAPVRGAAVAIVMPDDSVRARTTTDGEGRYQMAAPADGPCELIAIGMGLGRERASTTASPFSTTTQDFTLRARSRLLGSMRDEPGEPLVRARIELEAPEFAHAQVAWTDEGGAFAFAELPGPSRCLVWAPDGDLRLPVLASPTWIPDAQDANLRLSEAAPQRARIALTPKLPELLANARVSIRIVQLDTHRGAHLAPREGKGGLAIEGLMAGPYRIEAGVEGGGFVTLPDVYVDGRGEWNLGVLEWPEPGIVRIRSQSNARARKDRRIEFWRQREDTDVRTEPRWIDAERGALPAGRYAVLWVRADGARMQGALTIESGRTAEFTLPD
jgi:hypothetical protein